MSEGTSDALVVELFLANVRMQGVTYDVQARRRLVDVLVDADPSLRLHEVNVQMGTSSSPCQFPVLNVEKRAIIAAVPRETKLQMQQRSLLTHTVGRSATQTLAATLIVPPFVVEGALHVPTSLGNIGSKLTPDPTKLPAFVSVTGATLTLPGGATVECGVLLVSRNHVVGVSVPDGRQRLASAS